MKKIVREVPNWSKNIPSIENCTLSHCCYGFPQFKSFDKEKIFESIKYLLDQEENSLSDSYFKTSYSNYKELMIEYKKALNLSFEEAVDLIYSLKNGYIRYYFYIDLKGNVVEYIPCCG